MYMANTREIFRPARGRGYESSQRLIFCLLITSLFYLTAASNQASSEWRVLPIRSEYEFNQGMTGGEAMQLPHGIARSESNPNYIYWAHDNGGPWISTNAGETWKRCLGKGLYQSNSDTIQVDPSNPNIVFIVSTHLWYAQDSEFSGLYRSTDAGDNWELVLQTDCGFDWNKHRYIKSNIAYDPATKEATKTKDWYVAFHSNGLYKSTDYGSNWSKLASTTIDKFYQIAVGASDRVYLATDDGLFLYTPESGVLTVLGDLPAGAVTSVFVHPSDSSVILVTIYNDGLYKSTNGGANFIKLKDFDVQAGFYNPGYPDIIYLVGIWKGTSTVVTHDGGATWHKNEDCHNIPEGIHLSRIYGPPAGVVPNAKDPDEAVAFGNANIYKTTNGGVTFIESATLFTGYSVVFQGSYAFDQFDPNRIALGLADVGYVVTNNGGNWFYKNWNTSDGGIVSDWGQEGKIPRANTIYCSNIDFKPISGSKTIVSTVGYVSTNKGNSRHMYLEDEDTGWALETNFIPSDPMPPYPWTLFLQYHRTDPNIVYASQWKSTDGGKSYQPIDFSPYTVYGTPMIWGQSLSNPNVIYATYQYNQIILRSDDQGDTWNSITKPGWKFNILTVIPAFAVDPVDPNLIYSIDANKDIAKCEKVGDTWTWTSLGLLDQVSRPDTMYSYVRQITIDPNYPEIIYAVVSGAGISNIWRTTDTGTTWEDISYNLPRNGRFVIGVSPHTGELFAGGLTGTYVLPPPYESTNLIYDKCVPISPGDSNAPVLNTIGDKSVNESETITFTVIATDADGDTITYSVQNRPSGATLDPLTGEFAWTPSYNQAGTYDSVRFIATDDQGAQDFEDITITVNNVNRPPVAVDDSATVAEDSGANAIDVLANDLDADGDTLTITAITQPSHGGAAITGGRTGLTYTPAANYNGSDSFTYTVSDGNGGTNTATVTITVINVNRPPVLSAIGHKSVYAGDLLTFTLNATDPDGDTIEYLVNGLPSGAEFGNPSFSWTPSDSQVGGHEVTFIASDGQLQDTDRVIITVNATDNTAPSVTNLSPQADSIQAPLNTLVILDIADSGDGVDANSVTVKVNNDIVYSGNTTNYSSSYGKCRRIGNKAAYKYIYQGNNKFEFDQTATVTVNASDLAGNAMSEYSYSFISEMCSFGENKILHSGSNNENWGPLTTVSDSSGNIWVAWPQGVVGSRDIYVGKLVAGTDSFVNSGVVQVTTNDSNDQGNPVLAVDGADKLYLAWQDNRQGEWDIYISTSDDWSTQTKITDPNSNQINPAIAVDSTDKVYVVWEDDQNSDKDIYIASSTNSFSTQVTTRITSAIYDQTTPAIAVDSDNAIYVVWTDTRNGGKNDIYGAASNSGSWTNIPIVTAEESQSNPAIATEAVGAILHLVWLDDTLGDDDIYYASTSDGLPAAPLTGSSIIDEAGTDQFSPVIATTGSTGNGLEVFACWRDERNAEAELYAVETTANGTNIYVGNDFTTDDQSQPAIGIDQYDHPYLVWINGRTDICYAGSTFIEPVVLASSTVSVSSKTTVGTVPGSITNIDDVSAEVPQGAYLCDVKVTISRIRNPHKPPSNNRTFLYEFGPSGTTFSKPVTITIPYNATSLVSSPSAYWYNPLTGLYSQEGITDVEVIQISSGLYALRFKTTHFSIFGGGGSFDDIFGGGGGGGCSMSPNSQDSIVDLLLPYIGLAVAMVILKLRDRRKRKAHNIAKS